MRTIYPPTYFWPILPLVFSTPAYDYAPNPDKQWVLQVTDRMEPIQKKFTDFLMTKRLQTLQSIDEAVERVNIFEAKFWLGMRLEYFSSGLEPF